MQKREREGKVKYKRKGKTQAPTVQLIIRGRPWALLIFDAKGYNQLPQIIERKERDILITMFKFLEQD